MDNFKVEQITRPIVNLMLIYVSYNILPFLRDPISLGVLKLGCSVLDISRVDTKYSGYKADGNFILYGAHEF